MGLQNTIELNPKRFSAGLDITGPGQAQTTNSLTLSTSFVSPGTTDLPGLFMAKGGNTGDCVVFEPGTTLPLIVGVVVNDKFNQNAPANLGGTVYHNQGDMLDIMSLGRVVVQTIGSFDPMGDLYINNSTGESAGKLQNSATAGYHVGGPSYTNGKPPVRVVSPPEDSLIAVEISF